MSQEQGTSQKDLVALKQYRCWPDKNGKPVCETILRVFRKREGVPMVELPVDEEGRLLDMQRSTRLYEHTIIDDSPPTVFDTHFES